MAKALIEWETLDSRQIDDVMSGQDPRPPEDLDDKPKKSGKPKAQAKPSRIKPRIDKPASEH
jgi:cell division protease FtsH